MLTDRFDGINSNQQVYFYTQGKWTDASNVGKMSGPVCGTQVSSINTLDEPLQNVAVFLHWQGPRSSPHSHTLSKSLLDMTPMILYPSALLGNVVDPKKFSEVKIFFKS